MLENRRCLCPPWEWVWALRRWSRWRSLLSRQISARVAGNHCWDAEGTGDSFARGKAWWAQPRFPALQGTVNGTAAVIWKEESNSSFTPLVMALSWGRIVLCAQLNLILLLHHHHRDHHHVHHHHHQPELILAQAAGSCSSLRCRSWGASGSATPGLLQRRSGGDPRGGPGSQPGVAKTRA